MPPGRSAWRTAVHEAVQPLLDHRLHVDLEQQVGTAAQVEAEMHGPPRHPGGGRSEQVGDAQDRAEQAEAEDDGSLQGREIHHRGRTRLPLALPPLCASAGARSRGSAPCAFREGRRPDGVTECASASFTRPSRRVRRLDIPRARLPFYGVLSTSYGSIHGHRLLSRGPEEFRPLFGRYKDATLGEPVVVTQYGKPAAVILAAADYERLKELDRRVMQLDAMSDDEVEEMLEARIPPEHQYCLDDIPD